MTRPSPSLRYAPGSSRVGRWHRLTSAGLSSARGLWAPKVRGTWVDHPLSPGCRTSTDRRCLIGHHRRLSVHACSPRVALPGLDGWVVPFHAWGCCRSWCLWWPSLQCLSQSSCTTKYQSLCPAACKWRNTGFSSNYANCSFPYNPLFAFLLLSEVCAGLGNGCERFCTLGSLLGSYVHQESI